MPTAANQTDGNRCQQERDYFRYATQSLFTHPACDPVGIAESDRDQREINQKRNQREDQADGIHENQERREQSRAGDERHAERNDPEFIATTAIMRPDS